MEWFLLPFLFFAVIAITALLFGGWVVISLIRMVIRGIAAAASPTPMPPPAPAPAQNSRAQYGSRCANPRCRHLNPAIAQFCRHCGSALPAAQRVPVRRVAMW